MSKLNQPKEKLCEPKELNVDKHSLHIKTNNSISLFEFLLEFCNFFDIKEEGGKLLTYFFINCLLKENYFF